MDIHKPKPIHSIREFLSEIIVIITGVLIALALEQLVEQWHWQHQVESAEVALGVDLTDSVGQSHEREIVSDCVDRRLDEMAAMLDEATRTNRLPPLGPVGMAPLRSWNAGNWQSTLYGQTGEHFSVQKRSRYGIIYGFVDKLAVTNDRERSVWTNLYAMVGPGRPIEPAELASLRTSLSQARMLNQEMDIWAMRLIELTAKFIVVDKSLAAEYNGKTAPDFAICRPAGAIPAHYGTAPFTNSIERVKQNPIWNDRIGAEKDKK